MARAIVPGRLSNSVFGKITTCTFVMPAANKHGKLSTVNLFGARSATRAVNCDMRKRTGPAVIVIGPPTGRVIREDEMVIRDDCDPADPGWNSTGGWVLEEGDVNVAEFGAELSSPRSLSVIGHQAWRNDPPYLKIKAGDTVTVTNKGGRTHTFTEVENFGGGKIPNPNLNKGLVTAPECPTSTDLFPGSSVKLIGLSVGNHRFQCCINPWMRALIKVKPED